MKLQKTGGRALNYTILGLFALLLFTLLSGCIRWASYPEEWEELQEIPDECPNIAGSYSNIGQLGQTWKDHPQDLTYPEVTLTGELVYTTPGEEGRSATHVGIAQPNPGILEVKAWDESELITTKRYYKDKGDFKCESGFLVFNVFSDCEVTPIVLACGSRNDHFSKSADGALILKQSEKGVGTLMIVIPGVVSDSRWYRFDVMAP